MAKKTDDSQSGEQAATPTKKAFQVLAEMRDLVRNDPRPRFDACDVPELGPCRIRRYQPEVLAVLRRELTERGIASADQVGGLDKNEPLRAQCLRLIQRALTPADSSALLCPGDEGYRQLDAYLPNSRIAALAQQIITFNEIF
jgi:hypothetical protein